MCVAERFYTGKNPEGRKIRNSGMFGVDFPFTEYPPIFLYSQLQRRKEKDSLKDSV